MVTATTDSKNNKKNLVNRRPMKLPFHTGLKYLYKVSMGQHPQYQLYLQEKYNTDCYIIWDRYITLLNAEGIQDAFESYKLEKPKDITEAMKVMFFPTGGILGAESHDEWVQQRRMTTPALSESVIGSLSTKLQVASKPLYKLLDQAMASDEETTQPVVLEMDSIFSALTLDTIALITLGKSFGMVDAMMIGENIEKQDKVTDALNVISQDAIRQSVSPRWVLKLWKPGKKVQQARDILDSFLNDCIKERLNERKKPTIEEETATSDLLNILLDAEENGVTTRDETKAQLLTFIFAGYDTTAHTLSYMLYELAIDKKLQNQIAMEVRTFLPNRNEDITISMMDLRDDNIRHPTLTILDCAWMETLRKYPSTASGPARKIGSKPIIVGDGIELPANTQINIPPYALHRNPKYWHNPEQFDCSRWMSTSSTKEEGEEEEDGIRFLPFGAGPRSCMGSRLARLEALTFMTGILNRYEVSCVETEAPIPYTSLTTKPKDGIRFSFRSRL